MKQPNKEACIKHVKRLKDALIPKMAEAGITGYGLSKGTGMTMTTSYDLLDPDKPSDPRSIIAAGREVGLKLVWAPMEAGE